MAQAGTWDELMRVEFLFTWPSVCNLISDGHLCKCALSMTTPYGMSQKLISVSNIYFPKDTFDTDMYVIVQLKFCHFQ